MAQLYRIPEGVRPQIGASFTGILADRGSLTIALGDHRELCRGIVEVAEKQFDIIGFDQMAKPLASILPGTVVSGDGELKQHNWTVGDGSKREAMVIELDGITSWQRAERL